jgi:hypothetical protein
MNGELLTGIVSFDARAKVSAHTMKISASIVTAFGYGRFNIRRSKLILLHSVSCDRQHNVSF